MAICMHFGVLSHLTEDMPAAFRGDAEKKTAWEKEDQRVLGDMTLAIAKTQRGCIRGLVTARAAWKKVLETYEPRLASNILHLRKELYQCRLEDVTSKDAMQNHISRMRDLVDRLASVGAVVTQEDAGVQLYLSLPDTYSHISAALSLKPVEELTFDSVASVLLQEERRLQGLAAAVPSANTKAESALVALAAAVSGNTKAESVLAALAAAVTGHGDSIKGGNSLTKANTRPKCGHCNKPYHTEDKCYKKHGYPVNHPRHPGNAQQFNAFNQGPYGNLAHGLTCMVVDDNVEPTAPTEPAMTDTVSPISASALTMQTSDQPPSSALSLHTNKTCDWLIDSGASQHICSTNEWFATYQPVSGKSVVVASGQRLPVAGAGDIHVDIHLNGRVEPGIFHDVLYAPDMAFNLLSVPRMTQAGLGVSFQGRECIIRSKDGRVIGRASRKEGTGSMYAFRVRPRAVLQHAVLAAAESLDCFLPDRLSPRFAAAMLAEGRAQDRQMARLTELGPEKYSALRTEFVNAVADPTSTVSQSLRKFTPSELAHLRMGHLNTDALPSLVGLVSDADWLAAGAKGPAAPCEACLLGKAHRAHMPRAATTRATEPLELVHSDVCGPFRISSIGGSWYYVLFIDDCTRLLVVYPIAKKSDVLDCFLTYKAWAEAATGKKLRALRTDGGGEYVSHAFDEHLRTCGITRQKTPPYTPEHNGVAERANRTIMEEVRALLIHARLPNHFWALALRAAVYLRNRSPTSAVDGMTPLEAWTGQRPSLGHLRVFGCLAYAHVPDVKRGKLDPKSRACTFVGYSTESKAYLLWDPVKKTVITSRDVTFVEHLTGTFRPIPSHTERPIEEQRTTNPLISDAGGESNTDVSNEPSSAPPDSRNPTSARPSVSSAPALPSVSSAPNFLGQVRQQMLQEHKADLPSVAQQVASSARTRATSKARAPLAVNLRSRATVTEPQLRSQGVAADTDLPQLIAPSPSSSMPPPSSSFGSFIQQLQSSSQSPSSDAHSAITHALQTESATSDDPTTFSEAMSRPDRDQWERATKDEYDSIQSAGTWALVPLPPGRQTIGCKWVFKLKRKSDGTIDRYKARLVAKGYAQKAGVDYGETFAPVAKFSAIRALLSMAAHYDFEIQQMDVKTAFLNGDLDHDIYMTQPEGYVVPGQEQLVCKLRKSLYGLKQAGRAWYEKIDNVLRELGFIPLQSDPCIYVLIRTNVAVFIALYVDDLLLLSNSMPALVKLKADLSQQFSMKDLGDVQYVLGIQIERNRAAHTLSISQGEYIRHVLERFGMTDCKPVATPLESSSKLTKADSPAPGSATDAAFVRLYQSAVGAIMYAMLGTRPDIAYAVTALSQFNSNPGQSHWSAVKHVLRYLCGTIDHKLTYGPVTAEDFTSLSLPLHGYSDSDWGSDSDDRRSVTGYVFMLGGAAVSWQARKQTTVALSSVEAEYMAATQATKEAMWWRSVLVELGHRIDGPTVIHSDSQGSIALSKNPEHHARSKHIDIRHHFVVNRSH